MLAFQLVYHFARK